jgi:glycogen debranching enzyme
MSTDNLRNLSFQCLLDLATDEGINASGKDEIFGCIFGRDSAITILKMLRVHSRNPSPELLEISKRALLTLVSLQGKAFNIESGEEPGKFIHEFRKDNLERLLTLERPWFVYPDGFLRNYDSVDSTPLTLIALYRFWQATGDRDFLNAVLPAVEAGLNWIITYGDIDKDLLLEYDFSQERKCGGLLVQSWTDSHESIREAGGNMPKYPIAPIEVQAYAWLAMRLWADYFKVEAPEFAAKLYSQSKALRKRFNETFILKNDGLYYGAQALDGDKNQIKTITGNPLLCLWAAYTEKGQTKSIVKSRYVKDFMKRAFKDDLFSELAGIRTMSSKAATFNPRQDSYHNGSFWPVLNGMAAEGLENFGFFYAASRLRCAGLLGISHFGSPIELYTIGESGDYLEYKNSSGQVSCRTQAWSAAATLDLLTTP